MTGNAILKAMAVVVAGVVLAACSEGATSPTAHGDANAVRAADAGGSAASRPAHLVAANLTQSLPEPFTARALLDPYSINQAPDVMLRSRVASDFAVQRLVTAPGEGAWHTHPGPSFAIVEQGQVVITRYSRKRGCTDTVYGPGDTYYEVAGEVHRASVVGPDHAVEYKVRFNTPVGEPFGNPVAAPAC
jgi:quercetin dioxygenase-like cupin family protein